MINDNRNKKIIISKRYAHETITLEKALVDLRKYELGFIFGVGSSYKGISLELRFEAGDWMTNSISINSKAFRTNHLLAYQF